MAEKNTDNYRDSIWKLFLDENNRFPIWVLDDFVINSKDLKIEWFLIKDWIFNDSKVIKSSFVSRWSEDLFISKKDIKDLWYYDWIKNILIEWNSVIWKKVVSETWDVIWRVYNLIFSKSSFIWLSIVVRKSFFWLFFYWKERIISKKNILDINKNEIIIKDKALVKA